MGMKIGQIALRFGCNDFGSLMIEENVVSAANTTHRTSTDEMERLIRDAGLHAGAPPPGLLDHRADRGRRGVIADRRLAFRSGIGYDSHRFAPGGPLTLGGVRDSE